MEEWNMLSYGLPKVKMKYVYLFYFFAYKLKSWIICYAYILGVILFFTFMITYICMDNIAYKCKG